MKQYLKCLIVITLVALGVTLPSMEVVKPAEGPQTAVKSETVISSSITEKRPEPAPKKAVALTPAKTRPRPSGSCAAEVAKYGWNQSVAQAVMYAESHGNVATHNDNPSTGDYSIGCFQVNLRGGANFNAKLRDSRRVGYTGSATVAGLEVWLKVARNNVAVAHLMWSEQGWTPWSATTCRYKVQCY